MRAKVSELFELFSTRWNKCVCNELGFFRVPQGQSGQGGGVDLRNIWQICLKWQIIVVSKSIYKLQSLPELNVWNAHCEKYV